MKLKLNKLQIAGICMLSVGILCFVIMVSLRLGMPDTIQAASNSQLSQAEQTSLITNFQNIMDLSLIGGAIGLGTGCVSLIVGYRYRTEINEFESKLNSDSLTQTEEKQA